MKVRDDINYHFIHHYFHRSLMRAVFIIQPLLGLPWVLACLSFSKDTVVFNYLFVIAGGLQVNYCEGQVMLKSD